MRTAGKAVLVALALGGAAVAARAQDGPVDKPVHKLGDSRTLAVFDAVSKAPRTLDEMVVTVASEQRTELSSKSRDYQLVYDANMGALRIGPLAFTPALQHLSFPLQVGKRWEHTAEFTHEKCGSTRWQFQNTVVGWEPVQVPAGAFRALRVDAKGRWKNSCGSDEINARFWYAPETRGLVRSELTVYARGTVADSSFTELTALKLVE